MSDKWIDNGSRVKRPLGVMPRDIAIKQWEDEVRFPQLKEAMQRFVDAELEIPINISMEYNEIASRRELITKEYEKNNG